MRKMINLKSLYPQIKMSIKNYIDEMTKIKTEIRQNNARNKDLRKRIAELEVNITEYLRSKDQEGLKYNGQAIIMEHKEKHKAKSKKNKQADIKSLLQQMGIENPDEAYIQLLECQKGDSIIEQKLAFKNL